jgi:hypothetical protein
VMKDTKDSISYVNLQKLKCFLKFRDATSHRELLRSMGRDLFNIVNNWYMRLGKQVL